MTRWRGLLVVVSSLAHAGVATAQPRTEMPAAALPIFRLFAAPPALEAAAPVAELDATRTDSLVRLPGDADSVFTLGGPAPSGQPRVRLAVEVNEAILRVLAPDPKVESTDLRGRAGGDWKPIDASGRPYQLRLGARIIW